MGRLFGYARVSTSQQCLNLQLNRLRQEQVEDHRIFTDKASGKNADRSGLDTLLLKVEQGDQVLVTKLDRLGRNTQDMISIVEMLTEMGVVVRFIDEGITTDGPTGKLIVTILSAVAEADRARVLERTNEGRIEAKAAGVKFGRKPSVNRKKAIELYNGGSTITEIAKKLKISRPSVYSCLRECKA